MKRARRTAVLFFAAVFAVALLCGAVRTQYRYFYCEAMGLLLDDPCSRGDAPTGQPTAAPVHRDCCTVVVVPGLPSAASTPLAAIPPTPLLAWLPFVAQTRRLGSRTERYARPSERAPPSASERRAELMIFLT